jgi:predicted DNA-binding transcriptional regulator AlpA
VPAPPAVRFGKSQHEPSTPLHVIPRAYEETIMSRSNTNLPPRFLRTAEAARFLGLSPRTLEKHRTHGTGPQYRKLGRVVVYSLPDLERWADSAIMQSTFDPNNEAIRVPNAANRDRR